MMRKARLGLTAAAVFLTGCGGGGPAPLGYALPSPADVRYTYGDTTVVIASMMGQKMEVAMRGSADYVVAFADAPDGVDVTMTVEGVSGSISQPLGAPINLESDAVDGEFVFSLDRRGTATVVSMPEVSVEASQMINALGTAHSFFPGLPDRVVTAGDTWVDTVSYEGEDAVGPRKEVSVLRYTVAGDTVVAGRTLLNIEFSGTSELANQMEMGGMEIGQQSTVDLQGYVLWDTQAGLMYEMYRSGSGEGSVSVPISPVPLPIELLTTQRARLEGM